MSTRPAAVVTTHTAVPVRPMTARLSNTRVGLDLRIVGAVGAVRIERADEVHGLTPFGTGGLAQRVDALADLG